MAAVITTPLAEFPPPPDDDREHLVLLREDPAFEAASDPELERWIATARRQTDVSCVALSLVRGPRQIIRMVGETSGAHQRVCEISSVVPLADYLLGTKLPYPGEGHGAFAEVQVTVTGKV